MRTFLYLYFIRNKIFILQDFLYCVHQLYRDIIIDKGTLHLPRTHLGQFIKADNLVQ